MHGQPHKILVVEDHEATRRALTRLLERRGWLVDSAGTVAEGLERLKGKPQCVILDLMLPDGDGETVLRHVRNEKLAIRVVVTSGVGDDRRLEAVRRLGADAVLDKPIVLAEVCRVCLG